MQDIFFGRRHAWLGLLILVPGLLIFWNSLQLDLNARALDASDTTTTATITERYSVEEPCVNVGSHLKQGCFETVTFAAFTYTAKGQIVSDNTRIGHARPELMESDTFTLTYLSRAPDVWQIDKGDFARKAQSNTIVGIAFSIFGVFVFWIKGGFEYFRRKQPRA